jgi:hypothetical protein
MDHVDVKSDNINIHLYTGMGSETSDDRTRELAVYTY